MEQELWRKISAFNKSDPGVLGLDNHRHIQKVKEEKYAYLIDFAAVRQARSEDCGFVTIDDRFSFMLPYTVGIPRNSALEDLFNEV